MEQLMEILKGVRPDVDFENETRLIDDGVIDSFDVIALVGEIDDAFGTSIDVADLVPENFNSATAIWDFIQSAR